LFAKGILINFAGNAVLRFLPPLIITREEIDRLLTVLGEVLTEYEA
ncbi:MAG TPA: aminotransferase class III-fold pyridoxal phosphate-dependent enzyme, partial [Desulfocapsa sulfexigens]|nr:aminotransferase class III-fold pyridoxal phosphate-dependent enzyme [Desulfocapsa sulfexigens]